MEIFYAYFNLITSIFSIVLGFLTFKYSERRKLGIIFALFLFSVGLWSFGICFHTLSKEVVIAHNWDLFLHSIATVIPTLFLHFSLTYNNRDKIKYVIPLYIVSLIFILVLHIQFSWFISEEIPIYLISYFPRAGLFYYFYILYYALCVGLSYFVFIQTYIKSNSDEVKLRIKYILFSFLVGHIAGTTTFLPVININVFPYGNFFTFIYCGGITYAILKHELMDIRLAVTQTVAYGLVIVSIIASFIIAYISLNSYPVLQLIAMLGIGIFWAFTAIPLSKFLVTTAKRKFIRGFYESDKVINKLSENFAVETDRQKIMQSVENALYDAFELERTTIIIAIRDQQNNLKNYLLIDKESKASIEIEKDSKLIQYFKNHPGFENFDDIEMDVRSVIQKIGYKQNEGCIILSLSSPEILEGLVILGKRSSGKQYNQTDFDFLNQINTYVSAIFYKLTPYEKIEKEFLANKKKIHDAEIQMMRSQKIISAAHIHRQFAHELGTPLSIIKMATNELPDIESVQKIKQDVLEEIERAILIIRETMKLSSTDELEERIEAEVDINESIKRCLKLIPPNGFEVETDLQKNLPPISGVYRDIQIVFTNLMRNSMDAMPNGGIINIKTYTQADDIIITFSDTGVGISDDRKEKVWLPYISGNQTAYGNDTGGRGWGLTIVNRIIEEHSGYISFESEIGKGTTFTIRLPAISKVSS